MKNNLPENIAGRELESIQESLLVTSGRKLKGAVYDEKDKQEIAKYAPTHGFAAALRKIKEKFPNINESTVSPFVKKCKENLKQWVKQGQNRDFKPTIGNTRGQPLSLDEELDLKLRTYITLRTAGAGINVPVVSGVLNGLVRVNPETFSGLFLRLERQLDISILFHANGPLYLF